MANTISDGKLGRGIVVTDIDGKSKRVNGIVEIDAVTGIAFGLTGSTSRALIPSQQLVQNIIIALGTSVSPVIDLSNTRATGISMPAAWTAANITLLTSTDNITYNSLYGVSGVEYTITANIDTNIIIPTNDLAGIRYLKIRSGTKAAPVNQAAARTLIITSVY